MENVLITGGAGFIGSNFIKFILENTNGLRIINLDKLTYAGNLSSLEKIDDDSRYVFKKGDITDKELLITIFEEYDIKYVVNFAAESHVDRSILSSSEFINTNVLGTNILLEVAKEFWKVNKDKNCRNYKSGVKYLQVSTDEVYGDLGESGLFVEDMPLMPNNPYSASKASADLMVRAYFKTHGLPINITRCSNNYGPNQFPEKLIPLIISNALKEKQIPVYGDGSQIRDWLYVEDHCSAILEVLKNGNIGEIYNIGGNNEKANIDIIKEILDYLGVSKDLITFVADRPGHDKRYAIDNTKILEELNWTPRYDFNTGIKLTIDWYLSNQEWIENIVSGDYKNYYVQMYGEQGNDKI